jgi:hypothetical protein
MVKALGPSAAQSAREEKEAMHNRPTRPALIGERLTPTTGWHSQRDPPTHGAPGNARHRRSGRLGNDLCLRPAHASPGSRALLFRLAVIVTPSLPIARQLLSSPFPIVPSKVLRCASRGGAKRGDGGPWETGLVFFFPYILCSLFPSLSPPLPHFLFLSLSILPLPLLTLSFSSFFFITH